MLYYSAQTGGFYVPGIHADIPADAVEITAEQHQALLAGQSQGKTISADANGYPVLQDPPEPTPAQQQAALIAQYEAALDTHLDNVARQHRYNDRFTFALRAGYPGPYQSEGRDFALWMDTCNVRAYELLQAVQAGTRAMPTPEEFIAGLPVFLIEVE